MHVADRILEAPLDLFAPQKALSRQNERVNQLEHAPAVLDLAGQPLHLDAIQTISPDRADIRSHAAPGDYIDFDPVFLEDLNDTDVSEAARPAGREGQANAAARNLAGQA